ncbi:hypothetical protein T4B_6330 [Trichinella pseudospiralis]|uniref:Uncharacterized protein n=2 Tax=Trichinella pseudospiralis TaxID=6337 RepID=A0A0V1J1U3_TRIPS|nr:hypothetical protein T4E_9513 [Trichinella pseudospiralis]KRY88249.1 hypothetical protein T4D_8382 [Trichinella pseudospiralis]KRZ26498.1 hypothetical protein T4C_11290 [Trichinella pseudospiralis]KRZ26525.1 hypothetical protein T4C_1480 [Trichinella pseudospiralis]KRZ28940.1 hypothetical protein T4B_6330 [Trichinella pseudospiralis]
MKKPADGQSIGRSAPFEVRSVAWTPPLAQYHRRRRWDKRVSLAIDFSFLQKSGRRFELANLTVRTDAQRCRPSLTSVPLVC